MTDLVACPRCCDVRFETCWLCMGPPDDRHADQKGFVKPELAAAYLLEAERYRDRDAYDASVALRDVCPGLRRRLA